MKNCNFFSQYSKLLPLVLVMGVATTSSALHRTLPHTVTSQLNIRLFQSKPSVYFLNNTLDNVSTVYIMFCRYSFVIGGGEGDELNPL